MNNYYITNQPKKKLISVQLNPMGFYILNQPRKKEISVQFIPMKHCTEYSI